MRTRVHIHDHLAKKDHVSTWCVEGSNFLAVEGAVHAAFVRAFGTSAGRVEIISLDDTCTSGDLYAKGMKVTVLSISDQVGFNTFKDAAARMEQMSHEFGRKAVAA